MKAFLAIAILFGLVACGGGDVIDDFLLVPSGYGSIAVHKSVGSAAITANYDSKKAANTAAINECNRACWSSLESSQWGRCGEQCVIALEIPSGECGALARSSGSVVFGFANNSSLSKAKSRAVDNCGEAGGLNCAVILDKCND